MFYGQNHCLIKDLKLPNLIIFSIYPKQPIIADGHCVHLTFGPIITAILKTNLNFPPYSHHSVFSSGILLRDLTYTMCRFTEVNPGTLWSFNFMNCKYTFQCRQIERINLSLWDKKKCMSFYAGFAEASFTGYIAPNVCC